MKKIKIKNLRALKETPKVSLLPLTILLGKNSIGKSSFLRTFPLFKQSISVNRSEPLLWYLPELVDFGSFRESVYKNEENTAISFEFEFNIDNVSSRFFETTNKSLSVNIKFKIKENFFEKLEISFFNNDLILLFVKNKNSNELDFSINGDSSFNSKIKIPSDIFNRETIIPNLFFKKDTLSSFRKNDIFLENIKKELEIFFGIKKNFENTSSSKKNSSYTFLFRRDSLEDYLVNNLSLSSKKKFKENFINFINKEHFDIEKILDKSNKEKILNKLNSTEFPEKIYTLFGYYHSNSIIDFINIYLSNYFKNIQYIAPIRATASRYYRHQGLSIDNIDPQGENIPMILANLTNKETKSWETWTTKLFNVVFRVKKIESNISIKLIKGNEEFNLADTGFGYSQLLPILIYLWRIDENQQNIRNLRIWTKIPHTLIIEQPELHLHPALQAKLMNIFIELVILLKEKLNFSIILETHSETMINQIGYNIINKKISSDLVNILLFEEINNEISIKETKFNSDGYLENWPIDFFLPEEEDI